MNNTNFKQKIQEKREKYSTQFHPPSFLGCLSISEDSPVLLNFDL